jgi:hypothetical protein
MEKSKLENIGNTQLFYLLKSFVSISDETNPDMDDYNLSDNCDEASRIVGLELTFPVDQNYIVSTLHLNSGYDFSTQKPNGEIKRPSFGLYEFDIDEHRIENVRRTYRHEMVSYDESLVISTGRMAEGEGWFDYTDGREVDVDYYDGETTDVNYDNSSVTKIK